MTQVYGSCSTGLDIAHSDLDILIVGFSEFDGLQVQMILHRLAECLSNYEWVTSALNLPEASVPILKLVKITNVNDRKLIPQLDLGIWLSLAI